MTTHSVEVVYRGVFQGTLAKNICRGIVLAARNEGKIGMAFGRYSDSPERNGIPAKQFAVVSDTEDELQEFLSRYTPDDCDVTIVADDTLCKGVESWAWYGLQPINSQLKGGGTLLITSTQSSNKLINDIHRRDAPYKLSILKSPASFGGKLVHKDDHTDVRLLGALAKVAPQIVGIDAMVEAIKDQWKDKSKVASAKETYKRMDSISVGPDQGSDKETYSFDLPGWKSMPECITLRALPVKGDNPAKKGGFVPGRSEHFKKYSTRSMRPVINFDTCTSCTFCWLVCPDAAFDITPDNYFDAEMEACCGCGVCQEVCPVKDCLIMVNEEAFDNNDSQWEMWSKDKKAYAAWFSEKTSNLPPRSHGYHHRGQYAEEIANEPA